MLSLYQLSIFLAVAQERSFSAAARKRHLTQPAVSQQVRALEQALGLPLFRREGQRIELTEAGVELVPLAGELLRLATRVEEAMGGLRAGSGGRLVLGHGGACFQAHLPRLLRQFRKLAAEIRVTVVATDNRAVAERLRSHELDGGFVDVCSESDGLSYMPLLRDRIVALVPVRHAWTRRGSVSLAELSEAPLVLPSDGCGLRAALEHGLRGAGISPTRLNVVIEAGGADGLGPAVEAGMGVSIAPRSALRQMPPRIRGVDIEAGALEHVVYWARLPGRLPSRAMHRFHEYLTSAEAAAVLHGEPAEP